MELVTWVAENLQSMPQTMAQEIMYKLDKEAIGS